MDTKKRKCACCDLDLDIGVDVLGVKAGVMGHERFIPLDELVLLCGETCAKEYFTETPSTPTRIP